MKWKMLVAALFVASAAGATGYYVSSPQSEPATPSPAVEAAVTETGTQDTVAAETPDETEAAAENSEVADVTEPEPTEDASATGTATEAPKLTLDKTSPLPVALAPKITLSGTVSGTTATLSWKTVALDAKLGFKVVYSTDANPVYPGNEYLYLTDPDVRTATWKGLPAGKTLHFRVCEYLGGKCGTYSNDISLKTGLVLEPVTTLPKIVSPAYITVPGELTLTVSGLTSGVALAWTPRTPKAFSGYKVVRSDSDPDPYYPKSGYLAFVTDSSATQWTDSSAESGKVYWYRICSLTTDGSPMACGNTVRHLVK